MKKKKKTIFLVLILIIVIGGTIYICNANNPKSDLENGVTEYTPQEEISSEQLRQTLITLYFKNKETGNLMPEARMIDSRVLLNNPYLELTKLLLEGPKNESLEKLIPDGTIINKVEILSDIVQIDFSEDFTKVGNLGAEAETEIICSIVNTLTELTEVNGVKILINGEENKAFEDEKIKFDKIFTRETE